MSTPMSMTDVFRREREARECTILLDAEEFSRRAIGGELRLACNEPDFGRLVMWSGARPGSRGGPLGHGLRVTMDGGATVLAGEIHAEPNGRLVATRDLRLEIRGIPRRVAERLKLPVQP